MYGGFFWETATYYDKYDNKWELSATSRIGISRTSWHIIIYLDDSCSRNVHQIRRIPFLAKTPISTFPPNKVHLTPQNFNRIRAIQLQNYLSKRKSLDSHLVGYRIRLYHWCWLHLVKVWRFVEECEEAKSTSTYTQNWTNNSCELSHTHCIAIPYAIVILCSLWFRISGIWCKSSHQGSKVQRECSTNRK